MSGQDRGPIVVAVTVAMIAASTVFVLLRLISRITIVKRVGLDDYLIVGAWCLSFGLSFSIAYAVKYELGRHQNTIPLADLQVLQRLEYTFSVLYNPTLILTKTSICVFFLSLSEVRPVFRYSVISTMVVIIAAGVALSLLNIFQCSPMSSLFQIPRPDDAKCIDIITLYLSSAPVNIITDLVLMLLPMPILKSMWIPRKQKIILYVLFGFGIFITAVDIVRISYLQSATQYRLEQATMSESAGDTQQTTDFSWYASYSFLWTAIEVNVGIMVASAIHLKPLVTRFMPKMLRDEGEMTPQKRRSIVPTLNSSEMAACHRVPSATPQPLHRTTSPLDVDDDGANREAEEEAEVGFMDFITTPDMRDMPTAERTQTAITNGTTNLTRRGTAFLNFVDMTEQKSIVYMTNKESFRPVALVTCLFFIWGFAYGLLNSLNGEFQLVARWSTSQTIALHGLYYAGYFFGPLTIGRWILKHWGFKATYIIGLMIYGTGTLVFWPAAVLTSFAAFLISNFIVGVGLSTLEIGANPFMALCGPARYAEARLNLSQGVQAIGTVISPILAKKALFHSVQNSPSLVDTQWTYLAISLLTFILAFIYYIIDLPEVTDAELEAAARVTHPHGTLDLLRRKRTLWLTLGLGVAAQFLYVAAQEAVGTSIPASLAILMPSQDVDNFEAIGHALFAASRFLAGFMAFYVKPRYLLLAFLLGAVLFSSLAMALSAGTPAAAMILLVYFFEGPLFSLIFVAPLRGLGRDTKDGAALMTAAISGGAILEPIQWAVANARDYQYSYCVIVAFFAAAAVFPLYLNFYPLARVQVDPRKGAAGDLSAGPDLPPFQTVEQTPNDRASSRSPSKEMRGRGRSFLAFAHKRRKTAGNDEVDVGSDGGS